MKLKESKMERNGWQKKITEKNKTKVNRKLCVKTVVQHYSIPFCAAAIKIATSA
jgi:hypothetical protein